MGSACPPQIVFLISVPRSGSTLLQKILAAHPEVASTGEPWILLPLAFMDRDRGVEAVFAHQSAARGIREMIENLPEKRRSYTAHLRRFCLGLFEDLARGKPIFLDKDPRYYLILDFLVELFPDAKFIFLFRNPLDVMCSMMSTWLNDRLMLHAYHVDLYEGVRLMSRGCRDYADQSINVHYERLVGSPRQEVHRVCDFLAISYCDELLAKYKEVDFGGSMGDPTGIHRYEGVSTASVNIWPKRLNNWYRIRFARKYLQALGDDALAPWGISLDEFEKAVRKMNIGFRGSLADMAYRQMSDFWRLISGTRLRKMLRERKFREVYLFR
jgi:Sulfotransferase family